MTASQAGSGGMQRRRSLWQAAEAASGAGGDSTRIRPVPSTRATTVRGSVDSDCGTGGSVAGNRREGRSVAGDRRTDGFIVGDRGEGGSAADKIGEPPPPPAHGSADDGRGDDGSSGGGRGDDMVVVATVSSFYNANVAMSGLGDLRGRSSGLASLRPHGEPAAASARNGVYTTSLERTWRTIAYGDTGSLLSPCVFQRTLNVAGYLKLPLAGFTRQWQDSEFLMPPIPKQE
ncbi:hypothetical protein OsJ_35710 [Oryza sativa Japonica Group]|uniref:Uncharacterized protein n=1 Tax=Oryza sativa subsp. japonica TaxID=39947 RepID=A3CGA3_ORYSJ|nr:hypothetical protein OsJ_35710 [Oryza sativa Japonica Group]